MASFRVYQKPVNNSGTAPIYVGFYLNREKIEIPTKISIAPKYFDEDRVVVKCSYEFAYDQNLIIQQVRSTINDILVEFRLKKKELTKSQFLKAYRNPGQSQDFFVFCREYQKLRFQEIKGSTQKKHKSCLENLKAFKDKNGFPSGFEKRRKNTTVKYRYSFPCK